MEILFYLHITFLAVFTALYSNYFRIFLHGLTKIKITHNAEKPRVSVIIPARNERENIGSCIESLLNQSYPKNLYEIIVVDDESEDDTRAIVEKFQLGNSNIKLATTVGVKSKLIGRVKALNCGLAKASNEIVFITDADCKASYCWIEHTVGLFSECVGLVCGYSAIDDEKEKNLWIKFQAIENIAFLTLCAGGINTGLVIGATGQNMAFRKNEFLKIGGFEIMQNVHTGDDVVFINNWKDLSGSAIKFSKSIESIVKVKPIRNISDLFNQHKRWLSSMPRLVRRVQLFYLTISILNILIIIGTVSLIFSSKLIIFLSISILIKLISELAIVLKGLSFLKRYDLLPFYFFYEIVQIPFIIICGVASVFTKVRWKERSIKVI